LTIPQRTKILYHRHLGLSRGLFTFNHCQARVILRRVVLFRQPPSGIPPLQ